MAECYITRCAQVSTEVAIETQRDSGQRILRSGAAGAYWLYQYGAIITAATDSPKDLSELQDAVSDPRAGYDIHHIVEQTSAERDGFDRSQIDDPENLVRIPTLKHWEINAWYQTRNEQYGGLTPREYLRGKSWDERRQIGLDALMNAGVLK